MNGCKEVAVIPSNRQLKAEILSLTDQLVQQFNSAAAKSAETFLKLAETLARAEDKLSKRNLSLFCEKLS